MTVSVVDALKIVHVNHYYAKLCATFGNGGIKLGGFLDISIFIFEPRQRIGVRQFIHDRNFNLCLTEIFKVVHAVRSRLEESGVKVFNFVTGFNVQAPHAFDIFFASRFAVISKISGAISHRVDRQNDIVLNEKQDEYKN